MINDRFFIILGLMMLVPVISTVLISIGLLDATTATMATMGINLGMLYWIRKTFKTGLNGMFGGKIKFQCLTCAGTKFDGKGTCWRCGSKARKSV